MFVQAKSHLANVNTIHYVYFYFTKVEVTYDYVWLLYTVTSNRY